MASWYEPVKNASAGDKLKLFLCFGFALVLFLGAIGDTINAALDSPDNRTPMQMSGHTYSAATTAREIAEGLHGECERDPVGWTTLTGYNEEPIQARVWYCLVRGGLNSYKGCFALVHDETGDWSMSFGDRGQIDTEVDCKTFEVFPP